MNAENGRHILVLAGAVCLAGCGPSWYAARADREVAAILSEYGRAHPSPPVAMEDVIDTSAGSDEPEWTRRPAPPDWATSGTADRPKIIDLPAAEALGITYNRDYLSRRETLYLTALALTGARHAFALRPTASIEASTVAGRYVDETVSHTTLIGVSKKLLFGGTVTASVQQSATTPLDPDTVEDRWSASAALTLTQPLLQGFGREVSQEPLIQARRNLIYDLREFFQYRQDFAIDVARAYWNLQQARERVHNQERSLKRLEDLKAQTDARFKKGLTEAVDRYRAAGEVLRARADLSDEQQAYALALDQFKTLLGLPIEAAIGIADDQPQFKALTPDLDRAVRAALRNRVDLRNATDGLEDSARSVRLARQALLAALDLTVGLQNAADGEHFDSQRWGDAQASVGLRLNLPVDRTAERNAYRQVLIAHERAQRAYSLRRDQVVLEVRERIRELRNAETTVELQRQSIEELKHERAMAVIHVERGEASNRDVVDAESRLLEAENRLVGAQVNHAIARLRFFRSVGTLAIDEKGMWQE